MLILLDEYAGRIDPATAGFPNGRIKNETVPGVSDDGTPNDRNIPNNIWGALEAILADVGFVADGNIEQVGASQVLDAIKERIRRQSVNRDIVLRLLNAHELRETASDGGAVVYSFGQKQIIVADSQEGLAMVSYDFPSANRLAPLGFNDDFEFEASLTVSSTTIPASTTVRIGVNASPLFAHSIGFHMSSAGLRTELKKGSFSVFYDLGAVPSGAHTYSVKKIGSTVEFFVDGVLVHSDSSAAVPDSAINLFSPICASVIRTVASGAGFSAFVGETYFYAPR